MPKRTATVIASAVVLLTLAAVPAMATSEKGKTTQEVSAVTHGVAPTVVTRTLASVHTQKRSGLRAWHWWRRRLHAYERETWYRERLMGSPLTRSSRQLASGGLASLIPYTRHWKQVVARTLYDFRHPPMLSAWLCIHHYEGAWTDSGAPYWGGLQMDLAFQQKYGPELLRIKGTANRWTPMEQIWVAMKAWRTRGFSPWPNTARDCGLL